MKTLNKTAAKTLTALTANMDEGTARKIDNTDGTFMAVHVNRLHGNVYSVAHYYEQNGDLCPDPDMTFLWVEHTQAWIPLTIQQWCGYREGVILNANGTIKAFRPRENRDQASFANMWMTNIKRQQGGLRALRKAAA